MATGRGNPGADCQDFLRQVPNTGYAWLAPSAALSKRSALAIAGVFSIGVRAREEALSTAVQTIVKV